MMALQFKDLRPQNDTISPAASFVSGLVGPSQWDGNVHRHRRRPWDDALVACGANPSASRHHGAASVSQISTCSGVPLHLRVHSQEPVTVPKKGVTWWETHHSRIHALLIYVHLCAAHFSMTFYLSLSLYLSVPVCFPVPEVAQKTWAWWCAGSRRKIGAHGIVDTSDSAAHSNAYRNGRSMVPNLLQLFATPAATKRGNLTATIWS